MTVQMIKHYGFEHGLSVVYRNFSGLHTRLACVAVSFKIVISVDDKGTGYVNYEAFSLFESWLLRTFKNTVFVQNDDPQLDDLTMLEQLDLATVIVCDDLSYEGFARWVSERLRGHLVDRGVQCHATVVCVEVRTTHGDGARYIP